MTTSPWTFADVPDQTGRTAIVTGANAGIGLEAACMLAERGAHVVLACRNPEKGKVALARVLESAKKGSAELMALDLSDLDSVKSFAEAFAAKHTRLDLLILNAGVMIPPFARTKQGFEVQFGTNHLGHFALAARLFPIVERTPGARIVALASGAARGGKIHFEDPNYDKRGAYGKAGAVTAYCQSKLANMLFVRELDRRIRAAGSGVRVVAAHPGYTATDLQRTMPLSRIMNAVFAMKPHDGALPTMRAAVDPSAESGSYWGPARWFETSGPPARAEILPHMKDEAVAKRLWDLSEKLTGVAFPVTHVDASAHA